MNNSLEQQNITPDKDIITLNPRMKEAVKKKVLEFIKEETRMVRGIFHNHETPGGSATIIVEKYPGIPKFKMSMIDGCSYEIPLYVARFLNGIDVTAGALADEKDESRKNIGTCSYPVHGFKMTNPNDLRPSQEGGLPEAGGGIPMPIIGITRRERRYGFSSMEGFM